MRTKQLYAIVLAALAALFYAVSTPVSKILLNFSSPTMLAAFLYLGAGVGISMIFLLRRDKKSIEEKLTKKDLPYTIGMIVLDMAAPILLMNGIARTAAANVSLLNNFEIVATALIAFFVFREKISARMWIALTLATLSSVILSFAGSGTFAFSPGSLFVIAAAACWGLENNCTRMIASKSTYEIVIMKGFFSGSGSLIIALILGEKIPELRIIFYIMLLGFIAYGLSIFVYIRAQNVIGAAKTSAFYALAPFIGAFLSFLILQENLTAQYGIALAVMVVGSALAVIDTLVYRHSHIHIHTLYKMEDGGIQKRTYPHEHEHFHIGPGLAHHHMHTDGEIFPTGINNGDCQDAETEMVEDEKN